MNIYEKENFSLGQISALAALVLGSLILVFAWAPSTVQADSATDQYTEPQPPTKPPVDAGDGNSGEGDGNSDSGAGVSSGDTDSSSDPSGTESEGSVGSGEKGDESKDGKQGDKSDESTNDQDTEAAAAALGGSDDDSGGGSSLPLIILLVIGIPALAVGAWYLYGRYGPEDDDARDRLRKLFKSGGETPPPPEKP